MPRHLLLLRHAEADAGPHDRSRPLTPRGRRDADGVGALLAQSGPRPERVVSSPALRALETARAVAARVGVDDASVIPDERIYENTMGALARVLEDHKGTRVLLLVGHNPGLEGLLESLCGPVPPGPGGTDMPPGALAIVALASEAGNRARLDRVVRPGEPPT